MLSQHLRELLDPEGDLVTVIERSVMQQASPALTELARHARWIHLVVGRCGGGLPCPRIHVEGSWPHGELEFVGPLEGRIPGPWSERSLVERCLIAAERDRAVPRSRS